MLSNYRVFNKKATTVMRWLDILELQLVVQVVPLHVVGKYLRSPLDVAPLEQRQLMMEDDVS